MKLIALCVFTISVFSVQAQEECDPNLNACGDADPISTIDCDGTSCTDWPEGSEDPKSITAEICREKCQENSEGEDARKCKFYRWEQVWF